MAEKTDFKTELTSLLNRYSAENGSNTPDFILAEYLTDCLSAFDKAVCARSTWYGRHDAPGEEIIEVDERGNVCGPEDTLARLRSDQHDL